MGCSGPPLPPPPPIHIKSPPQSSTRGRRGYCSSYYHTGSIELLVGLGSARFFVFGIVCCVLEFGPFPIVPGLLLGEKRVKDPRLNAGRRSWSAVKNTAGVHIHSLLIIRRQRRRKSERNRKGGSVTRGRERGGRGEQRMAAASCGWCPDDFKNLADSDSARFLISSGRRVGASRGRRLRTAS